MKPVVEPLSVWRRKLVFVFLLLAFIVSLPAFIFYATGYHYDFSATSPTLTATGGFYITAAALDTEIFINDVLIDNARTFRNASYIQRLEPGRHRLHVQAPGLHTWVKELLVYPGIVTEAEAFNLPLTPQLRLVTEFFNSQNVPVILPEQASSTVLLALQPEFEFLQATSLATSTYRRNQEYTLLRDLFAVQASTTAALLALPPDIDEGSFGFATVTTPVDSDVVSATTTVTRGIFSLFKRDEGVYISINTDNDRLVPYYFCPEQSLLTEFLEVEGESEITEPLEPVTVTMIDTAPCRTEIKIDTQNKAVIDFDFYPDDRNLVLLQLTDGLYVTEVDDRAWQNSQPLYLGEELEFLVYREGIFVRTDGLIFEVLPEIAS